MVRDGEGNEEIMVRRGLVNGPGSVTGLPNDPE